MSDITYRLSDGFAYRSEKINPSNPELVRIGSREVCGARFRGMATLKGKQCCVFRLGRHYLFQYVDAVETIEH